MNLKIEAALRPRIGDRLADYGLVVSCEWRIGGPNERVAPSDDFGPGESRRDRQACSFYDLIYTDLPIGNAIEARADGAARTSCFWRRSGRG